MRVRMKKKNLFIKLLSLITYKEKQNPREFVIPEINEEQNSSAPQEQAQPEIEYNKKRKPVPVRKVDKKSKEKESRSKTGKQQDAVFCRIGENIDYIRKQFNYPTNSGIIIREFLIAGKSRAFITYLDGMADDKTISDFILRPLLNTDKFNAIQEGCPLEYILFSVLEANQVKKVTKAKEVIDEILLGNTGIYVDGCNYYIFCETTGYEKRSVEKPQVEGVVKGPQEGFNEDIKTNIILIRRIIKNKDLVVEMLQVGERNNNQCAVLYIKGLTNPAIVAEVKRRINSIKTDAILAEGTLEQFIEDNPFSIIPSVLSTERPDRTASHLLEGKVAVLVEGSPFAAIVPVTIFSLLHSPEDTALRWQYGTLLRFIRTVSVFVAVLLPGLYVALTNFHREMIPTNLLIAIAKAKENVPFPTIFEVFLMEIAFELIREAGIRIPGIIGNTIGIIGALIIGQAAVQANLVSPVLIIIIAFTGLGNFAIPDFNLAFGARLMSVFYIILGGALGFFGISLGMLISLAFLVNQKSFGVSLLSTVAPKTRRSNDLFVRLPIWKNEMRPDNVNPVDVRRQPPVSRQWVKEKPASAGYEEKRKSGEGNQNGQQ